jgi:uncharacterized membrane-anchored protein
MRMSRFAVVLALLGLLAFPAKGQQADLEALIKSLQFQEGRFQLEGGVAEVATQSGFVYLDPANAERFLVELWGNRKGAGASSLGLLIPTTVNPVSDQAWGIVLHYEKTGYVSDSDAEKIDYAGLLKEMQQGASEANAERRKEGLPTVDLIGWAKAPHYDKPSHTLYWAKQLRFEGSTGDTLNYNVRVLGRHGVMVLNVVAGLDGLGLVEREIPKVQDMVKFRAGETYEEFVAGVDEVAAYGIAGLIAGGVLAKSGFFKALLIGLLASKKLVLGVLIAAAIGGWAFLKRFFKKT